MRGTSSDRGLVRAGVAASLRAYLARYPKVHAEQLIRAAGIDPQQLADPDALLDLRQWVGVLEAAAHETDDACFAIELAAQMPWKDLGVLGYVALNSATVGAALDNAVRYLGIQNTRGKLSLDRGPRTASLTYTIEDPEIVEIGQVTESTFAFVTRLVRESTGDPRWGPRALQLRHAGPGDPTRHERFFRCPVRFGQRASVMVLAVSDLAKLSVSADAGLLPFLLRHATECLARMPKSGDFLHEVRGAVLAAISAGDPAIEDVAQRLGTSARSLQRRLREAGFAFKTIVEETRLALAQHYLRDASLSLTETAFLLGYSDLSAFSRAFRRWTGSTALDYRRNQRADR